jgi:hypothetical protein
VYTGEILPKEMTTTSQLEAITEDAAQLIHHLRCSNAPDDVLAEATGHIRQAMETLAPFLQQGEGWSTISIASDTPGFAWNEEDLTAVMPYSPVTGKRNPIAPPIRMWKEGNEVHGEATFSPTYAGPPDSVRFLTRSCLWQTLSPVKPDLPALSPSAITVRPL